MTPAGADRLLLLVAGLAVDGVFGDMAAVFRRVPHPIALAGSAIAFFDRKLNRETRSQASRRYRGIITVIVLVGAAAALGLAIERFCRGHPLGAVVEALLIAVLVAQRSLYEHVAAVAKALNSGGLAAGRRAVRHIVGRDPASLDAHGVVRAAIESLAENFSDGVAAAIFAKNGRPDRALVVMVRDGCKHHSPNAGWPESAMAGALGLALAGPRRYPGSLVDDPWLGDGNARAATSDIARALQLYRLACLIEAGLLVGAWLAVHFTLPV